MEFGFYHSIRTTGELYTDMFTTPHSFIIRSFSASTVATPLVGGQDGHPARKTAE